MLIIGCESHPESSENPGTVHLGLNTDSFKVYVYDRVPISYSSTPISLNPNHARSFGIVAFDSSTINLILTPGDSLVINEGVINGKGYYKNRLYAHQKKLIDYSKNRLSSIDDGHVFLELVDSTNAILVSSFGFRNFDGGMNELLLLNSSAWNLYWKLYYLASWTNDSLETSLNNELNAFLKILDGQPASFCYQSEISETIDLYSQFMLADDSISSTKTVQLIIDLLNEKSLKPTHYDALCFNLIVAHKLDSSFDFKAINFKAPFSNTELYYLLKEEMEASIGV